MSFKRWFTAKEILGDALEVPADRQRALVLARCADDETLLNEVLAMLACQTGFLETPAATSLISNALPCEGALVAGRYRLEDCIGRGGFGRVHRATDERTGEEVAVKLVSLPEGETSLRVVRGELAALRRARIPGVVELIDDGVEGTTAFMAMRFVRGNAFPGRESPLTWAELRPLADRFLNALGHLHAVGVVHRDLKPDNVLVDADGGVTLVDLGVAFDVRDGTSGEPGRIAGTPSHMAPEILEGGPPTIRSDLFAVGVMFLEALTGEKYQPAADLVDLVRMRCEEPPPDPEQIATVVPADLAPALARLLAIDPEERPRDVAECRRIFDLEREPPPLARLGSGEPLARVVEAVRRRRSLDVSGTVGSGRSRLLRDAARLLEEEGFRVVVLHPSGESLGSLSPLLGEPAAEGVSTPEAAEEWACRRVERRMAAGTVVFADDEPAMDATSRSVLSRVRESGSVVRAVLGPAEVRLEPLRESDLLGLFAGPDRFLHLREDAAAALHARTGGIPGLVVAQLEAWVRDGVAIREGGVFRASRGALDRLPRARPFRLESGPIEGLGADARQLAPALDVAFGPLSVSVLAGATGLPPWRAEAGLRELESAALVTRDGDGDVALTKNLDRCEDEADRTARHLALAAAMARDAGARVDHLVAAERFEEACSAACDVARRLLREGLAERAHGLLVEMLAMARREDGVDVRLEETALELLLEAALALGTPAALDALVYSLERAVAQTRPVRDLELLARAALAKVNGDAWRALSLTDVSAPLAHPGLDRSRHVIRMAAGRMVDPENERRVLAEALAWARSGTFVDRRSHCAEWLGWHRYRNLEFGRAASLHARAARRWRNPRSRMSARLNAASAAMEDGRLDWARTLTKEALATARSRRDALAELRATWLLRCVGYRQGTLERAEPELVAAVRELGARNWVGLYGMTEAAIAWRSGRAKLASDLALDAARELDASGKKEVARLMRALAAAAGEPDPAREAGDAEALVGSGMPRLVVQTAALLVRGGISVPEGVRAESARFIGDQPEGVLARRCEVLSLEEGLATVIDLA